MRCAVPSAPRRHAHFDYLRAARSGIRPRGGPAGSCEACDNVSQETPMTAAAPRRPRYPTIEDVIGNTPVVRLARIASADNDARGNVILGKLEGNNPAGSVKDRPAISMIR